MCGICGEVTFEAGLPVRRETVAAMRERIAHRGPDAVGLFVSADARAGLGFRRLAIIDLSPDANQPMTSASGTVHVAFNGEIYNFRELRAGLQARGRQFRTQSDTEVILHLYDEHGAAFVDLI